jgi:hypothetical protein
MVKDATLGGEGNWSLVAILEGFSVYVVRH